MAPSPARFLVDDRICLESSALIVKVALRDESLRIVSRKPEHPDQALPDLGARGERSELLNTLRQQIIFKNRFLHCSENSNLEAHMDSPRDPRPEVQAPRELLVLRS